MAAHLRFWAIKLRPAEAEVTTKAGTCDDTVNLDQSDSMFIGGMLKTLKRARRGHGRLFSFSPGQIRRRWTWALAALGVSAESFCLHALRHGGASRDAAEKRRPLLEIQKRGRWRTTTTLLRYEKHGRLQSVLKGLKEETVAYCEYAHPNREELFRNRRAKPPPFAGGA